MMKPSAAISAWDGRDVEGGGDLGYTDDAGALELLEAAGYVVRIAGEVAP